MKTYKLLSLGLLVWGFSSCDDGLDRDVSVAGVTVTPNENVVCEGVTVNVKKENLLYLILAENLTISFSLAAKRERLMTLETVQL